LLPVVRIDDNTKDILIDTSAGMKFDGQVQIDYNSPENDANCKALSAPVFFGLHFEICGRENVYVVDKSPIIHDFVMGVSPDKEFTEEDLRKMFFTDSDNCKIVKFDLFIQDAGQYYPISINLASRFLWNGNNLKMINYMGFENKVNIFIGAISAGK
jgi:hypothetical protein